MLDQAQQDNGRPEIEVLSVETIIRQPQLYLSAVLMVFTSDMANDQCFSIVADDTLSEPHDGALHQVGGLERQSRRKTVKPDHLAGRTVVRSPSNHVMVTLAP